MKKKMLLVPVTALIIICSSCLSSCYYYGPNTDPYVVNESRQKENTYYVPAPPHIPLLTEKNDLNVSVLRSSGSKYSGGDFQVAYMAGENIVIGGSFSTGRNSDTKAMNYNRFELLSGFVKKINSGIYFKTDAGLGTGDIKNIHYTGMSTIGLTHFFLQPGIIASNEKQTMQFAIASRFSGINFNVKDTSFTTDREPFSNNQLISLYNQPFHIMWEPSLVFRTGWKQFLFTVQYNHSSDLTNSNLYRSTDNFSIGFSAKFNTKKM